MTVWICWSRGQETWGCSSRWSRWISDLQRCPSRGQVHLWWPKLGHLFDSFSSGKAGLELGASAWSSNGSYEHATNVLGSCSSRGRITVTISGTSIRFFCRAAARVEGGASQTEQPSVSAACRQALSVDKGSFQLLGCKKQVWNSFQQQKLHPEPRISGLPSQVNAAISLLAYDPVPMPPMPLSSQRLTELELAGHFGNLTLDLKDENWQWNCDVLIYFTNYYISQFPQDSSLDPLWENNCQRPDTGSLFFIKGDAWCFVGWRGGPVWCSTGCFLALKNHRSTWRWWLTRPPAASCWNVWVHPFGWSIPGCQCWWPANALRAQPASSWRNDPIRVFPRW